MGEANTSMLQAMRQFQIKQLERAKLAEKDLQPLQWKALAGKLPVQIPPLQCEQESGALSTHDEPICAEDINTLVRLNPERCNSLVSPSKSVREKALLEYAIRSSLSFGMVLQFF